MDLTGQPIDNVLLSKVEASIGTYRDSDLDIATFNQQNLGTWMLCNGQDCSTTEYFGLTGKINVPDFLTEGTFRRQAKAGRSLGTFEADENKSHKHYLGTNDTTNSGIGNAAVSAGGNNGMVSLYNYGGDNQYYQKTDSDAYRAQPTGGPESRPKNHACNVFIKVDHI